MTTSMWWLGSMVFLGIFFVIVVSVLLGRHKDKEKTDEEVKAAGRWLVNKHVWLVVDGQNIRGLVDRQEGSKCYINWLTRNGNIVQSIRYEDELKKVENGLG